MKRSFALKDLLVEYFVIVVPLVAEAISLDILQLQSHTFHIE